MLSFPEYTVLRDLLLARARPVETEAAPLLQCALRVLAQDVRAEADVPAFDRSPYDGYAFRAADSASASDETPVTLRILEEIAAGAVPTQRIVPGTAAKILTGAPIPEGADAVTKFEETEFTAETVTLFAPYAPGSNIVRAGEDVRRGALLAVRGQRIDAGVAGVLAAQGLTAPQVYRTARVAVLSTGSELAEADVVPQPGQIRNSNAYSVSAALCAAGLEPVYLGIAADDAAAIAARLDEGLRTCDAVIVTGGVSVGDYDLTPAAMEACGAELLARGVLLKPGMACAYGVRDGKLIFGLSGNPASCLINLHTVAMPALRRLTGLRDAENREITVRLQEGFPKKSPLTRVLRGTLVLESGRAEMALAGAQGNVALTSTVGCDVMAVVPAGSGALAAGTELRGFLL